MTKPPIVWTIAGFDPSSGAGITADLKTIASHNCFGVSSITALTVQNTLGVYRVETVSSELVRETLRVLLEDMPPSAIKIGMLANKEIAVVVADFLEESPSPHCPIVLDPVIRSSSGTELLDGVGVRVLCERLLPLTTVLTPNRAEASALTGQPIEDVEAMAQSLRRLGASAVVVTGGDACCGRDADYSEDVLAYTVAGMDFVETLSAPRIHSNATHGTGCAFSTAIACALACGMNVPMAVTSAKSFVRRAIEEAPGIGKGKGPMGLDRLNGNWTKS